MAFDHAPSLDPTLARQSHLNSSIMRELFIDEALKTIERSILSPVI